MSAAQGGTSELKPKRFTYLPARSFDTFSEKNLVIKDFIIIRDEEVKLLLRQVTESFASQ